MIGALVLWLVTPLPNETTFTDGGRTWTVVSHVKRPFADLIPERVLVPTPTGGHTQIGWVRQIEFGSLPYLNVCYSKQDYRLCSPFEVHALRASHAPNR